MSNVGGLAKRTYLIIFPGGDVAHHGIEASSVYRSDFQIQGCASRWAELFIGCVRPSVTPQTPVEWGVTASPNSTLSHRLLMSTYLDAKRLLEEWANELMVYAE